MTAITIIAMIFAMFATGLLITIYILRLQRKMHWQEALALGSLGVMFLAHLFLMIGIAAGSNGMSITSMIFYLLAWPGLATAFLMMHLDLFAGLAGKVQAAQAQQQGSAGSSGPADNTPQGQ